jgi:hypothetical protein
MNIKKYFALCILAIVVTLNINCSSSEGTLNKDKTGGISTDTIKAQRFDMGRMWTFDNPPVNYLKKEYKFLPDNRWLEKARKAALRLGNGCSASFISEDGLVMTNHHCVRGVVNNVAGENENILRDGFSAGSFGEERKIDGLFVSQLVLIVDVTEEIRKEMDKGKDDEEKIHLRDLKEKELKARYTQRDSSLSYEVLSFYNGGKYSVYGYKIYNDIRLVFVPDLRTAKPGGDYDNFTYPRHGLDCAFLRAYENGKPAKTPDYFKWNEHGAEVGEPIFVVGNPGNTDRIKTMKQIEYDRDVFYPAYVELLGKIYNAHLDEVNKTNAEDYNLIAKLYSIGNTLKVLQGTLESLNNPVLMARKQDFENKFRNAVNAKEALKEKYGKVWDEIAALTEDAKTGAAELSAFSLHPFFNSEYFNIARDVVKYAKGVSTSGSEKAKSPDYLANNYYPADFDFNMQDKILAAQVDFYYSRLGKDNPLIVKLTGGKEGKEAVKYIKENSALSSKEKIKIFLAQPADSILKSNDPLITFIREGQVRFDELKAKNNAIQAKLEINEQLLGRALFEVYGEAIPPDATGTLRISDGVIASYPYNGTVAPTHTTFYGLLEKYYSYGKKFPFNLPAVWEKLPADFDLSAPLDFICTNDIIGGNSGSPVINKNLEIVGLAFDGNYESLADRYIYTTEKRRTICVHPKGMLEAIRHLYKFTRLGNEIISGRAGK